MWGCVLKIQLFWRRFRRRYIMNVVTREYEGVECDGRGCEEHIKVMKESHPLWQPLMG